VIDRANRSGFSSPRGSAMVEFALMALVLSVLMAGTVDFGRLMYSAQGIQDIARIAARELALTPLRSDISFECALYGLASGVCPVGYVEPTDPVTGEYVVRQRVYNPACLVVDLNDPAIAGSDAAVDAFFATMPIVNRSLRPLMIIDQSGGRTLLRFPGALLTDASSPPCAGLAGTGLTVRIPRVTRDPDPDAHGVETGIEWLNVLEEIRPGPDPTTGPFSLTDLSGGVLPNLPRGIAAVRINYPYQAGMMTGFQPNPDPLEPNVGRWIVADGDAAAFAPPPGLDYDAAASDETLTGAYAGKLGLGRQLAFAQTVRPFRKLIAAQAIYRREVFE
jgi:hypothetical protein